MVEGMQIDHIVTEEMDTLTPTPFPITLDSDVDLETYLSGHRGFGRIMRLNFIIDRCPSLRVEALRMLMSHLKKETYDVQAYLVACQRLAHALNSTDDGQAVSPDLPSSTSSPFGHNGMPDVSASLGEPVTNGTHGFGGLTPEALSLCDQNWVESTRRKAHFLLERLDADLKTYKSNSIKESIRRGSDELGEHYLKMGDLGMAFKCFSRSRDYCTSHRHELNLCFNLIRVAIFMSNWSYVSSQVHKASSNPELSRTLSAPASGNSSASVQGGQPAYAQQSGMSENRSEYVLRLKTQFNCAMGLCELSGSKYKAAARKFLLADHDNCDFAEVLTPANVAVYGGLCALASFERNELQKMLLKSNSFRQFLEAEPRIRDIILNFYNSKYADCLSGLDALKTQLQLDFYISNHVNSLYKEIRSRALCQMSSAFNTSVQALEEELTQLILAGRMNARIDSHGRMLYARETDQRSLTFEKALQMSCNFQKRSKILLMRCALIKHQISVKDVSNREESDMAIEYPDGGVSGSMRH